MNLRPHRALKPGRYVLDQQGRLHPLRRRYHVQVVAIVHIKAKAPHRQLPPLTNPPEAPANRPLKAKIDLSAAPSAMEQKAASWRGQP